MRTRIISFHNGNIDQAVLDAQKSVFDHFEIPLEQIQSDLQHPDFLDWFLANEQWDTVVIFDIDCIPLNFDALRLYIGRAEVFNCLSGVAQHASHIPNSADYVSPAFMVLTQKIYDILGKPSFIATPRGDVGAEFTYRANELGARVYMKYPTHVVDPKWPFSNGRLFGIGTTYGNIFHAFESRMNPLARLMFIEKCREVVGMHHPAH